MRYLLDTHVFLWAIAEPDKLSRRARAMFSDTGNEIVLSTVNLWEIALKVETGKLRLPASRRYFENHMEQLGVSEVLEITPRHVYALMSLPSVHKDPFDRLLAAQSISEGLPLMTADAVFRHYPLKVVW
jgi:PIN domain nuclease of toxin-antitoxin system